jgi:hypothetical protein
MAWLMATKNLLASAILAPVLFVPLVLLTGAVKASELRQLAARGTAS